MDKVTMAKSKVKQKRDEIITLLANELDDVVFEAEMDNRVVGLSDESKDMLWDNYKRDLEKLSLAELKALEKL